jgi:hypothetical protein
MTSTAQDMPAEEPAEQPGTLSALPVGQRQGDSSPPANVAELIRALNASHEALKDLWSRIRRTADIAFRSEKAASQAEAAAAAAKVTQKLIQDEQPQRRAPLFRQLLAAAATVALDGLACWFAAQALDGGQLETMVWAGLFLAVLGGGEWALDYYRDRRRWPLLAIALGLFVTGLGVLRFSYLATVGSGGLVPALAGAALFTAATAGFLVLGYRALRAAETVQAWKARRQARAAARAAADARSVASRDMAEWDRLADTYVAEIRHRLLEAVPFGHLAAAEAAVRAHLLGQD